MIGVINPTTEKNFDDQLKFAKNASLMFSPGQIVPEVAPSVSTASTSPTSTTTMAPENSAAVASKSVSSPTLSTGSIIGISLGGAALLLTVALLLYICGRKRSVGGLFRPAPSQPPLHPYYPSSSPSMASAYYAPNLRQHDLERSQGRRLNEHRGYGETGTLSETQRSWSPPFQCDGHNNRAPILPMMTPYSPISETPGSPRSPSTMIPIGQGFPADRSSRTPTYQTFHYPLPLQAGKLHASPRPPPPIFQSGPHELGSGRPDSGMDHVIRFNHRDSDHHRAPVIYP